MRFVLGIVLCAFFGLSPAVGLAQAAQQQPAAPRSTLAELYSQFQAFYEQGRYREAEPPAKAYLTLAEKEQGPDGLDVAWGCNNLGLLYRNLGRYPEALPLFVRAAATMEKVRGPDSLDLARVLRNLAWAHIWTGQAKEGERTLRRALAIRETSLGRDDPSTIDVAADLATALKDQGRYAESLTLEREALAKVEAAAPDSIRLATRLNNIGTLLTQMGQFREANLDLERALAINRKPGQTGREAEVARTLSNLAWLRLRQGQFRASEELYKHSYDLRAAIDGRQGTAAIETLSDLSVLYIAQARFAEAEANYDTILEQHARVFGSDSLPVANALNNRGILFYKQGRFGEAESDFNRSLALRRKILGARHPDVASTISSLGWMKYLQGKYPESESLLRLATAIREQALGPNNYDLGDGLSDLAVLYAAEGRYEEAEPLRKRFLDIARRAFGERSIGAATALAYLANYYRDVGRLDEAVGNAERALSIQRELLDPAHPDIAASLETLGEVATHQGRLGDAERLLGESLNAYREAYGDNHPALADISLKLGRLQIVQQRYELAQLTLELALQQASKGLEPTHPRLASIHDAIAQTHIARGSFASALAASERFAAIRRERLEASVEELAGGIISENRLARPGFIRLIEAAYSLMEGATPAERDRMFAKAFEAAQLLRADATAGALARTAVRFASGSSPLAGLVRERIRLVDQWRSLDRRIAAGDALAGSARLRQDVPLLRNKLAETATQIAAIDKRIAEQYPGYVEVVRPQALTPEQVLPLLGKSEALILIAVGDHASYSLALGPGGARLHRAGIGIDRVRELVFSVRAATQTPFTPPQLLARGFDASAAFALYDELIRPLAPAIGDADYLMVVPDDALQSLPLAMLLTEQPQVGFADFAAYRSAPWLGRHYALATLPSVSSLQALRRVAKPTRATMAFTGVGDPVLGNGPRAGQGRGIDALLRGRTANVNAIRRLDSLPETAEELRAIAAILGAGEGSMLLGARATETNVRRLRLENSRVVMFATHGLLASETAQFGTSAEPALVLTPPRQPSEEDDGLLTASEIVSSLKLDADWVILSACNTAGPERDGAEGLSGLAKAFFYAGTRALLVSHWAVPSDSTALLTTGAFAEIARNPAIGRAEALRRSMTSLMARPDSPQFAHPVYWAPFVVVGEGGARR